MTIKRAAVSSAEVAAAWDGHVRDHPRATYLQTTAWAAVKAVNGWRSRLVLPDPALEEPDAPPKQPHEPGADPNTLDPSAPAAQLLVRPLPVLPWSLGYAARGPLVEPWTPDAAERWTDRLRGSGGLEGIGLLRMDPELEAGEASTEVVARLGSLGWRRARDAQPTATRVVDLRADEAGLWSDVRKKWRQYVNHARKAGIVVRDVDADSDPAALDRFGAIMRETSLRAGIPVRATSAYRDLWSAFRPAGEARLLFADDPSGTTLAALLLVRCGHRVTEPYGGMIAAGAEVRANYLLKWEAIRRSREEGATQYDLWGLPTPGIAHFKEGFGGREVRYVGAWDLDLDPLGAVAIRAAEAARSRGLKIRNRGRSGESSDPVT
jgi:peptidoglycan pentaglycine glycine transferase (the first glycine)